MCDKFSGFFMTIIYLYWICSEIQSEGEFGNLRDETLWANPATFHVNKFRDMNGFIQGLLLGESVSTKMRKNTTTLSPSPSPEHYHCLTQIWPEIPLISPEQTPFIECIFPFI